jgi:hypothetical protein
MFEKDKDKQDELALGKQLKGYMEALRENLSQEQKENVQSLILEVETLGQKVGSAASKADLEPLSKRLTDIAAQATEMMNNQKENQVVIDKFVAEYNSKQSRANADGKEPFDEAWHKMTGDLQSKKDEVDEKLKNNQKVRFEMKTTMTTSNTITGTGVLDYNSRQGIVPTQKTNMRDLLTTVQTQNGLFVTYRETNSLQAFTEQTEGSAKAPISYAFTPGTATLKYIAGFATFTKQLMFHLPFINSTLPRMLTRDFYKKENSYLYTTIAAAATGSNYSTATVDVEEVIDMITNMKDTDFEPSYIVTDWTEWGRLLKTKPSDYSLPAGTIVTEGGRQLIIAGVPIVGASFAASDKLLVIDRDYVERVEGESLRVEFSYENQDNFEKNLVTARCECFEEVNLLRTDAVIYRDLGNS